MHQPTTSPVFVVDGRAGGRLTSRRRDIIGQPSARRECLLPRPATPQEPLEAAAEGEALEGVGGRWRALEEPRKGEDVWG